MAVYSEMPIKHLKCVGEIQGIYVTAGNKYSTGGVLKDLRA
jgi:hypothetical protein